MKILIVSPIAPANPNQIGGTKSYTLGLANHFARNGHVVSILGIGNTELNNNGVSFYSLSKKKAISTFEYVFRMFLNLNLIKSINPDILSVQLPVAGLPFLFSNIPIIVTMHGSPKKAILSRRGKLLGNIVRLLEYIVLHKAKKIIFVDDKSRNEYAVSYPGLSIKFSTLPIGIDLNIFKPAETNNEKLKLKEQLDFKKEDRIFIFVGRLCYEKNVVGIIDLFNAYLSKGGDGKLLVIGNGYSYNQIIQKIDSLKLKSRIKILTNLTKEKIAEYLRISDIFLMASVYEGLPTAALEALASGIPVISTNVGDLPSIIVEGKNGKIIYDLKNYPDELIRAVGKNNDHGWASNCKNSCRAKATLYSWDIMSKRIEDAYLNCTETK